MATTAISVTLTTKMTGPPMLPINQVPKICHISHLLPSAPQRGGGRGQIGGGQRGGGQRGGGQGRGKGIKRKGDFIDRNNKKVFVTKNYYNLFIITNLQSALMALKYMRRGEMQQESVSELHSKDDTPGEEDTLGDGLVM